MFLVSYLFTLLLIFSEKSRTGPDLAGLEFPRAMSLDQTRHNGSYLELKSPFRAKELWADRIVLELHFKLHRHGPDFAQFSNLQAHRKCHFVTLRGFPVHKHTGIGPHAPSVWVDPNEGVIQQHMVGPSAVPADREPLLCKHVGYEFFALIPDRSGGADLPFVLPDQQIGCRRKDERRPGSKQPVTYQVRAR